MDQKEEARGSWKTAKADYMRAKWARERAERKVERLGQEIGDATDPAKKKDLSGDLKEAKSVLSERKTAEKKAEKEYRAALKVYSGIRSLKVVGPMVLDPMDAEVPLKTA